MTIPWMMNCGHKANGWCLECVQRQRHELDTWRTLAISPYSKLDALNQQAAEGIAYAFVDQEMSRYDASKPQEER